MRITSIKISNYRQYKNAEFKFNKVQEYDLHVIIGSNGVGKTNLLNAITWCFYGIEPHLGNESKALPIPNLTSIKESESVFIDVSVEINIEDNDKPITFLRTRKFRYNDGKEPFPLKDTFKVIEMQHSGNSIIHEDENTKIFVNRYVPEKIREYFFFDGEQLDNYFLGDQSILIRDSVFAISQVQLLHSINERLLKVKETYESDAAKSNPNLEKLTKLRSNYEAKIREISTLIDELEAQIYHSKITIKQKSDFLAGQDDIEKLEKEYQTTSLKLGELQLAKEEFQKKHHKFIREYLVLLTFSKDLNKAKAIIETKSSEGLLPPDVDLDFLKKMLEYEECLICKSKLEDSNKNSIKELIKMINISSKSSNVLSSIKHDINRLIEKASQYKIIKISLEQERVKIVNEFNMIQIQNNSIHKILSNYSNKEEIKNAFNDRDIHIELEKENTKKLGVQEEQRKNSVTEKEKLDSDILKAVKEIDKFNDISQCIDFLDDTRKVSKEIQNEMMIEVKDALRVRTIEHFKNLVWKKNTYSDIVINDNYDLDLRHEDGYSCLGSCSAAERALLALSFTLSLHQVSGFKSMLVIDTPVSRISDTNRVNFANVLKDVSKNKQIIMLFTPSEYSDEIRAIFETIDGSVHRINTSDERSTKIEY